MGAYHQLGYQSANLVLEPHLSRYAGAVLSPVNYTPADTLDRCNEFRQQRQNIDIVFDPQLYVPRQHHGQLSQWSYMPNNLDTSSLTSADAWIPTIEALVASTRPFAPNGICSPAPVPKAYVDEYYGLLVDLGNELFRRLEDTGSRSYLTALVGLPDLSRADRHLEVASILSRYAGENIYLVLSDDTNPRRERTQSGEMEAAARLIQLLVNAGYQLLVSTTSSEMVLWKAAGAQHVATGKFFNLRRFTPSRFSAQGDSGGTNLWYWFEPSLLAFLRQADLARFMKRCKLSALHDSNPYSRIILDKLPDPDRPPVLADSWRQFLFWFAEYEHAGANNASRVASMLDAAEAAWAETRDKGLRLEERENDGQWVRAWNIALNELRREPD